MPPSGIKKRPPGPPGEPQGRHCPSSGRSAGADPIVRRLGRASVSCVAFKSSVDVLSRAFLRGGAATCFWAPPHRPGRSDGLFLRKPGGRGGSAGAPPESPPALVVDYRRFEAGVKEVRAPRTDRVAPDVVAALRAHRTGAGSRRSRLRLRPPPRGRHLPEPLSLR